jgi:hypothetical protein
VEGLRQPQITGRHRRRPRVRLNRHLEVKRA